MALALAAVYLRIAGRELGGPARGPWPFALKPQIEAAVRAAGPGAPVLNDYVLGGFLSYEVAGVRIFGDDRCELYGDNFLREWLRGERDWYAAWVARFDIKIALAESGTPLEAYLRATPAWREVARHPAAILFVRGQTPRQAR